VSCNFRFQGIATLCIKVIPIFWYTIQASFSGRIKQKEDESRYIDLTMEVRVEAWSLVLSNEKVIWYDACLVVGVRVWV
jgi:hypothetical protein